MWLDDMEAAVGGGGGAAGGFDPNATQKSSTVVNRSRQIVPFFIRHMLLLDDDLMFFGQQIQMVECYGVLRSQSISSTKVLYELEDWTGRIVCHLWLDHDPDQAPNIPNLMLNTYCRVVGTLKSLTEGRRVVVLKIEPMKHSNELLTFMLSAVCARYEMEKFKNDGMLGEGSSTAAANTSNINSNSMDMDVNKIGTDFQYKVYKAIEKFNHEPHGAHVQQIQKVVQCSRQQLMDTLEFLSNEGHAYTTLDDDHYKLAT